MSLLDTPPEIFQQIFGYIHHLADRSNLSQSCRSLHELLQATLYTEFVASTSRTAFLFIRTVSQNPSLAVLVQRLVLAITYPNLDCHVPFGFAPTLAEEDWSSLKQQLKAYCATRDELASGYSVSWAEPFIDVAAAEFFRNLIYQRTDDISACLLLLLPKLKSVQARQSGANGVACWKVLQMARTLQVRKRTGSYGPLTSDFALSKLEETVELRGAFELPSIRKFDCGVINSIPTELSNCLYEIQITDLTLRPVRIHTSDIGKILKKCLHIERLRLCFSHPTLDREFNPAIFFDSIIHLKNKLQSLTIINLDTAEIYSSAQYAQRPIEPIAKYLSTFHKLRRLEVLRDVLFGKSTYMKYINLEMAFRCEYLPASLTHLVLFDSVDMMMTTEQKTIHGPSELEASSHQEIMTERFKKYGIALSYANQ